MLMKSLWEKASEMGSKAKDYLKGENEGKKSPEVEEVEKHYSEKFTNLKREIEKFQKDSVNNFEEKIKSLNEIVEKLNSENQNLTEENKNLKEEVRKSLEEKNEIQEDREKLNNSLNEFYKIQEEKKTLYDKLQDEYNKSQSEIRKLEDENKILKDTNEKMNILKEKYMQCIKSKNEVTQELNKLKENKNQENLIYNFDVLKKELEELNNKIKTDSFSEESKNFLNKINTNLEENIKKLNDKFLSGNQQVGNSQLASQEEVEKLTKENDSLNEDLLKLKRSLNSFSEDKINLENKLDHHLKEIEKLYEELKNIKTTNEKLLEEKKSQLKIIHENDKLIVDYKSQIEKKEKIINESNKSLESFKSHVEECKQTIQDSLKKIEENKLLSLEKDKVIEDNQSKLKHYESMFSEYEFKFNDYESKLSSLSENLKTYEKISEEKSQLDSELRESKIKISSLERDIENSTKDKSEVTSLEQKLRSYQDIEAKHLQEYKKLSDSLSKLSQTFKQFFLMLLEEDIFIDVIEKSFNSQNIHSDSFFEDVYRLSKFIKPKYHFKIYHTLLSDDILLEKLSKFNLDSNVENLIQEYLDLKSLDQLIKLESKEEKENFLKKLLLELCSYFENLNKTLSKQNKTISDLNSQLKSAKETLDEGKKHDGEKYDLLNKHITKLQQDCRDNQKTEKLLKENIEGLEGNIRELKSDNENKSNKLKSLNNMYEEMLKEKNYSQEKISSISQQFEMFKIENTELIEKNNSSSNELNICREKIEILHKEKNDLNNKLLDLEKLKSSLHEKIDLLSQKDLEINKLMNAYNDLQEFIENLKNEKEHTNELLKKQIFEMAAEMEDLKQANQLHEEKLQNENSSNMSLDRKKFEDMEKLVTDLEIENKHLKEQKDKMKKYSEEILIKVKNDLKDTEFLIDKRMISNILIKYFDPYTDGKIRMALLDTLANFMGYNNDERRKIGLQVNTVNIPTKSSNSADKLKDLSNELYDFILNA
jgi:chromosome segregation ATPase